MSMTPDKVRALADTLFNNPVDTHIEIITKWLEQNQAEPIAVGLSDEQIKKVSRHIANEWDSDDYIGYEASLRRALPKQTFVQSEVKKVVVGLSDEQIWSLAEGFVDTNALSMQEMVDAYNDWAKGQTFTKPEIKEIPVGLSDEQIKALDVCLFSNEHQTMTWTDKTETVIRDFLESQTFAQPEPVLSNSSVYAELYQSYQDVKKELKSQQFVPNWDDAPDWAKWLAQDQNSAWHWYESKPISTVYDWKNANDEHYTYAPVFESDSWRKSLQQRPQTPP